MSVLDRMKPDSQQQPASKLASPPAENGAAGDTIDPFEKVYDTPEEQDAVDRVVGAGSKIIYSEQGTQSILESLKSGDPPESIARTAFNLMMSLDQKSKGTIPEDAMMPAAVKLLALIAELGSKGGAIQTDANTVPQAMQHLVALGIENGIIDPAEIEQMMSEMDPAELESMRAEQDAIANGGQKPMQMAGGDPGSPPPPGGV